MRKIIVILIAIAFLAGSCIKKTTGCAYSTSNIVAPALEQEAVVNYLNTHSITTATKHSSGLYYQILAPGADGSPSVCSQIQVSYKGTLENGTQFDANTSFVYDLGALIEGWKKALPLVQKGGHMMLYIPPTLGYGSNNIKDNSGNIIIPGNSILIFDITLINFN